MQHHWRFIASLLAILVLGSTAALFAGDAHSSARSQIKGVKLLSLNPMFAQIEIEYFYDITDGQPAILEAVIPVTDPNTGEQLVLKTSMRNSFGPVQPEESKKAIVLSRTTKIYGKFQTRQIEVSLRISGSDRVLATEKFDLLLDWPSSDPFALNSTKPEEIERVYKTSVYFIDEGKDLEGPKRGLEQILLANPEYVAAYPELARIHMKTNW